MTDYDCHSIKLSVAICTHNPRLVYLQRTLRSLAEQTLTVEHWELLLIDNKSGIPLRDQICISWHPRARIMEEQKLGLTNARLFALRNARSDLVVFVDDDNVLDPDYLATAVAIHEEHPDVGVFGAGAIIPEFESLPPAWLSEFYYYLALRTIDDVHISDSPIDWKRPWGAGLCVVGKLGHAYLTSTERGSRTMSLDRCGDVLLSGGDDMFSLLATSIGMKYGIFPQLRLHHLIPKERLDFSYVLRLVYGNSYSHAMLAVMHGQSTYNGFMTPSWKAIFMLLLEGKHSLALQQFQSLIRFQGYSPQVREIMRHRSKGWEDGIAGSTGNQF